MAATIFCAVVLAALAAAAGGEAAVVEHTFVVSIISSFFSLSLFLSQLFNLIGRLHFSPLEVVN